MPPRARRGTRAGYALMIAISALAGVAAVLPNARERVAGAGVLVAAGWWLCIAGS